MAFNPLANFQKYKKIWMATLILLTMVTFVLCSGFGGSSDEGGFGGWLMRLFRSRGDIVAEIDGRNYYAENFRELKDNRELANKFMRKVLEDCKIQLEGILKSPEKLKGEGEDPKKVVEQALFRYQEYVEKLKKPRFFEGGIKLNDLVDFKIWLLEADRLGINLPDNVVNQLVLREAVVRLSPPDDREARPQRLLADEAFGRISYEVRRELGRETSDDRVVRALHDEYRVRLAKMVLRDGPNPGIVFDATKPPMMPRVTMTPDQWWEIYKKNRATFDAYLLPFSAEEIKKTVPPPGTRWGWHLHNQGEKDLAEFFEAHKNEVEDPTSEKTGLQFPRERFVVEFLMADPDAPRFKSRAETLHAVQLMSPAAWNPMMPPFMTYLNWPAADDILKLEIDRILKFERGRNKNLYALYGAGEVGDRDYGTHLLGWFAKKNAGANAEIANMVVGGSGDAFSLFAAAPLFALEASKGKEDFLNREWAREAQDLAELKAEVDKELPTYLTVAALQLGGSYYAALSGALPLKEVKDQPRVLPFSLYREIEEPQLIRSRAREYTRAAMAKAREVLINPGILGNPGKLKARLDPLIDELGLTLVTSKKAYTQFEMERAPELEPLKKAFEKEAESIDIAEGNLLAEEKQLKQKSFAAALFFGSGEKHSVEGRSYTPRPWPPDIEVQKNPELVKKILDYQSGGIEFARFSEGDLRGLLIVDPRFPKTAVPFFVKADNPILFWKHDPPKTEIVRWETEIRAEMDKEIARLRNQMAKDIGKAEADAGLSKEDREEKVKNIRAEAQRAEAEHKHKAEEEIRRTRERTLEAYKLHQARNKVAPELARHYAADLAKTGGEVDTTDITVLPYGLKLPKAEKELGVKGIDLDEVAPWQLNPGNQLKPFQLPKVEGIVLPRDDMAKTILALPTLDKPYETGNPVVDGINKELFEISKKAYDDLKEEVKRTRVMKPRIVQIIPNKARSVYYVALLRSFENPRPASRFAFSQAVTPFFHPFDERQSRPSAFLAKIYEDASAEWERDVMEGLRRQRNVTVNHDAPDAKGFDSDSGH